MKFGLAVLGAACAIAASLPATAVAGVPSATVTVTTASILFAANDMSTTALGGTPTTIAASVTFTTTAAGAGGTVTVDPATLTASSGGATLVPSDFKMTCKLTSGSGFTAAPAAVLNGPTTCGTLAAGKTNATCAFSINLTLNDTTTAATPFDAATFLGTFSVTATAS